MTFAIHVKAWRTSICYCSTHIYIQHWIAVSVGCDGPAALPPEQDPTLAVG
jgi:hypothetical protein